MESDNFLEKPCGRAARLEKSKKARAKRALNKRKKSKEYEEGFHGNYEKDWGDLVD